VTLGPGTYTWPYSFAPAVSSGTITLCVYLTGQLVGTGSITIPPPASAPTPTNSPSTGGSSQQFLSFSSAQAALRSAVSRRFRPLRSLKLRCSRLATNKVACTASFIHNGHRFIGTATARLSGQWIYMTWLPGVVTGRQGPSTSAPPAVEGPGSYSHATDSQFCATHVCIANFVNGRGYIVQCLDGEWSHSGGIQGACSYHGGEAARDRFVAAAGRRSPLALATGL
jgi:hypothetical protein